MGLHTYTNRAGTADPDTPVRQVDLQSHKVAEQVCKALGEDWHVENEFYGNGSAFLIQESTGLVLHWHAVTKTWNGPIERWGICGAVWPEGNGYGMDDGEMTVTVAKTPEKIVADIRRRLLDLALANHERIKLSVMEYALKDHEKWQLAQRLAALGPTIKIRRDAARHRDGYGQPCGVAIDNWQTNKAGLEVNFRSYAAGHEAKLDKLTDDQLVQLAGLVASWSV